MGGRFVIAERHAMRTMSHTVPGVNAGYINRSKLWREGEELGSNILRVEPPLVSLKGVAD